MSYPTFNAVPNFKTYVFDITDSLQIGTHLNIQLLSFEVRAGYRHFTESFQ